MAGTDDEPSIDPFDDPRWVSFEQVHQLLCQQLFDDPQVTAVEMNDAFAINVPTMKRSRMHWSDREMLSFEYWNEHDLIWSDNHLVLVSCPPRPLYRLDVPESFVGYAWLPRLARRWPTVFGPMLPKSAQKESQPGASHTNAEAKEREQSLQPIKAPPTPEEEMKWLASMQPKFDRLSRKHGVKSAWVRDVAFPQMQNDLGKGGRWKGWGSLRRALKKKIFEL